MGGAQGLGSLVGKLGNVEQLTSEQIAQAQRYVTARAISDDDQQMLLSMLGLEAA